MKLKKVFLIVTVLMLFSTVPVLAAPAPVLNLDGKAATLIDSLKVKGEKIEVTLTLQETGKQVTVEKTELIVNTEYLLLDTCYFPPRHLLHFPLNFICAKKQTVTAHNPATPFYSRNPRSCYHIFCNSQNSTKN